MKKAQGFTLIEVLVVVVIVAILAAVAIPSYQESLRKTRRADAKEALTRIAAAQERFFFTNNRYGTSADLGVSESSAEGYYTVKIYTASGDDELSQCGVPPCFKVVATPKATGPQKSDAKCSVFTLSHIGQKKSFGSDNKTVTTDTCW